jgi:branched-chain amino acid transport system permease protein
VNELQSIVFGVLTGSFFALIALGISLAWGFLKVINLSHFGLVLIGSYLTFQLATSTGMNPIATVAVTAPAMFALGALIQWGFERFEVSELNSLLISYGILIIMIQVVQNTWSADFQRMDPGVNPYFVQSIAIGQLRFPVPTLLAAGFAIALVLLAHYVLEKTYAGRALQAFGQDRQISSAFGIDHRLLGVLLAGATGASGAIAGMLHALGQTLSPDAPFEWVGRVFAIVILGGIGNVTGTLYAGLLVGAVAGAVTFIWSASVAPLVVFSLVVLALIFRPQGLFLRMAEH